MINLAVLTDELDRLESGEHKHEQDTWITGLADEDGNWCGTACCVAGGIVLAAGAKPVWGGYSTPEVATAFPGVDSETPQVLYEGKYRMVAGLAAQLLGLMDDDPCTAGRLFDAWNTLDDLRDAALWLATHPDLDGWVRPSDQETYLRLCASP